MSGVVGANVPILDLTPNRVGKENLSQGRTGISNFTERINRPCRLVPYSTGTRAEVCLRVHCSRPRARSQWARLETSLVGFFSDATITILQRRRQQSEPAFLGESASWIKQVVAVPSHFIPVPSSVNKKDLNERDICTEFLTIVKTKSGYRPHYSSRC